jgi:hypothetical protein
MNERRRSVSRAALAVALLFAALACTLGSTNDVAPQEWWAKRGPVVPHDSFPADCTLCHTGEDWHTVKADFHFDHMAETGSPLDGAHARAECLRCHNDRGPVQMFSSRGCAGCHEDVHRGQLGSDCSSCHGQNDWRPCEQIARHARTGFPLVGSHAATACWRCHPGSEVGNFTRVDTECSSCHADDLASATSPDHLAQGWTRDCDQCHIPTTWTGGGFNHGTWPLTGEHRRILCTDCHSGGQYAGTPRACFDCHQGDYNGATNPDHQGLNISTQCQICHGTSTWQGARFNHVGITNGCVQCHQSDYDNTTNPNHVTAGFPTSCEDCHNTNDWHNASFDHQFPLNSGPHKVFDCTDCHLTPNFTDFSCTHCHEHRQSEMDDEHDDVSGYVWSSPACYNCHPDGRE